MQRQCKAFRELVASRGSFGGYIEAFGPKASLESVWRLRDDLIRRFRFLSGVTSLHFLMMIGYPVVKPDLTVMRVFHRLGMIESEKPTEKNVRKVISTAGCIRQDAGEPIRYVDIVFSSHAMTTGAGLACGICLKNRPKCNECPVTVYCDYYKSSGQSGRMD